VSFEGLRAWMGRLGLTCAVACLIVTLLSGCASSVPPPEQVTITFAHLDFEADYYGPLAQKFNASHPYITVELRSLSWDMLNDVGVGDADIFVVGPSTLSELQEQGSILSLDPFIERDESLGLSDFYPGTVELMGIEGKTWAVPAGLDILLIFYSQDLFDQHGIAYPEIGWTWDDFLSRAIAISDPNAGIFGYATSGVTPSPDYFDAAMFVYQHGGRLFDDLQGPTATTFNEPLTVEAIEWYARLYHKYDVAPTPSEARQAFGGGRYAFYEGMRNGRVGMWMGVLSERGGLRWPTEWFVNWGVAPLPRDAQAITQAWVEGYVISSQTARPDVCWQWILFLSEQVPYSLMPARRSLAESRAYEQLVGENVAAVARASVESAVLVNPRAFSEFGEAMDIFAEAVGKVVNGDATPAEAMDWAQQEAEFRIQP